MCGVDFYNTTRIIIALVDEAPGTINFLQKNGIKIPTIVIGDLNLPKEITFVTLCKSENNFQEVIKAVAKNFNITAKIMAEKKVPDYYPISLKILSKLNRVSADIFICDGEMNAMSLFIQIADKGDIIEKVLKTCKEHQVDTVFIDSEDRFKVIQELTEILKSALEDDNLKQNQKLALHEQGFELIGNHIVDLKSLNEELLFLHKTCIENAKEIIKKIPGLKSIIDDLINNKSSVVYTHSILISFVCGHMVKHLPWGGQSHADKLAYIAFYHDLFLVPLYRKYSL
ncbi:MAG: hypothetical protein U0T83_04555 [Bacteriovoracaceae bacterium]